MEKCECVSIYICKDKALWAQCDGQLQYRAFSNERYTCMECGDNKGHQTLKSNKHTNRFQCYTRYHLMSDSLCYVMFICICCLNACMRVCVAFNFAFSFSVNGSRSCDSSSSSSYQIDKKHGRPLLFRRTYIKIWPNVFISITCAGHIKHADTHIDIPVWWEGKMKHK